jgi:hypothetical protein
VTQISKATEGDKRLRLSDAVTEGYLYDYDDEFVYFEVYEVGGYKTYKSSYEYDGTNAEISGDRVEVVRTTEYVAVETGEGDIEKSILSVLKKFFGSTEKPSVPVIKQLNEVEMVAVEPVYIAPGDVDGVGDTIDMEGSESLAKSINDKIAAESMTYNYFHAVETEDFHIQKCWVNPYECEIGGNTVPEGIVLAEVKYVNKAAWDKRVEGELMGLSVEGSCKIEVLDES